MITLDALNSAVTALPLVMPSVCTPWFVMTAATLPPPGSSSTTSVLTAPGTTRVTVPASADEAAVREAALADEGVLRYIDGKPIRKFVYVRGKLANVVV